jgi:hypothetical protein
VPDPAAAGAGSRGLVQKSGGDRQGQHEQHRRERRPHPDLGASQKPRVYAPTTATTASAGSTIYVPPPRSGGCSARRSTGRRRLRTPWRRSGPRRSRRSTGGLRGVNGGRGQGEPLCDRGSAGKPFTPRGFHGTPAAASALHPEGENIPYLPVLQRRSHRRRGGERRPGCESHPPHRSAVGRSRRARQWPKGTGHAAVSGSTTHSPDSDSSAGSRPSRILTRLSGFNITTSPTLKSNQYA